MAATTGFELSLPEPVSAYVQTRTGNKVSKRAALHGADNIELKGKGVIRESTILRGDLALLRFGTYCLIGADTVLRPAVKLFKTVYFPLRCGDHVRIGRDCVLAPGLIGNCVDIQDNVVVGKRASIRHNVLILKNSVVPADTVIPPFSVVGGSPAKIVGELDESWEAEFVAAVEEEYRRVIV